MRDNTKDKTIIVSGAVIFRPNKTKKEWFVVKNEETGDWEIAKTKAKRGESSVRAALRLMGEEGGMNTKVLAEAGRAGGATMINGKTYPQRQLYYLMRMEEGSNEPLTFVETAWLEYAKAIRKLSSKREKEMLKSAREELKIVEKKIKEKEAELKLAQI